MALNYVEEFSTAGVLDDFSAGSLGFTTPHLLIHVYDNSAPAQRVQPGSLTISAVSPYPIVVAFAQPITGYLAVHTPITASEAQGHYQESVSLPTFPYTKTIAGATHGLGTKALLIATYDSTGEYVEPGTVTVDANSLDVTLTFTQPFDGRAVIAGGYGVGTPSVFPFTNTTHVEIPSAQHGLGTSRIVVAVYDDQEPAHQLTAGAVNVSVSADGSVVLDFAQVTSGRVLLSGSQQATRTINVTDSVGVSEDRFVLYPSSTDNLAYAFTDVEASFQIDVAVPAFKTLALIIHVYDDSTPPARMQAGTITVDQANNYLITVTFSQTQSGYLVLHPTSPPTAIQSNYGADFSVTDAPYTHSIPRVDHGFFHKALLVEVYDTDGMLVEPGLVTIDASTFDVTLTFAQPFTGRVVIAGAYGLAPPHSYPFSTVPGMGQHPFAGLLPIAGGYGAGLPQGPSAYTVSIPASTHGLGAENLILAVWNDATPRALIEPAEVSIATNGDVLVTFAQPTSGLIALNGSVQAVGRDILAPETVQVHDTVLMWMSASLATASSAVTIADAVVVKGLLLRCTPSDAVTLDDTASLSLRMRCTVSDALAVSEAVPSILIPVLHTTVQDTLTLAEDRLITFGTTIQASDALSLAETPVLRIPRLFVTPDADDVTLADTPLMSMGGLVTVADGVTLGDTVAIRIPRLVLDRQDALGLTDIVSFESMLTVDRADEVAPAESATLRVPRLFLSVSDALTLTDVAVPQMPCRVQSVESVALQDTRDVRVPWLVVAGSETVGLSEARVIQARMAPTVEDALTLADAAVAFLPTLPAVGSETVALSDAAPLVFLPTLPAVGTETLYLDDFAGSISRWSARVIDVPLVLDDVASVRVLVLHAQASDAVLLTDTAAMLLPRLKAGASDVVTVTEAREIGNIRTFSTTDVLTLTDTALLRLPVLFSSVSASVSLADTALVTLLLTVAVTEAAVACTDTASVPGLLLQAQGSDILTLADSRALTGLLLQGTGTDAVTVGDVAVLPGLRGSPSVSESVTVTDTVLTKVPYLALQVTDAVALDDLPDFGTMFYVRSSDLVSVTDIPVLYVPFLAPVRSEVLGVSDTATVRMSIRLAVQSSVDVQEARTIQGLLLRRAVSDAVTIAEAVVQVRLRITPRVSEGVALQESRDLRMTMQRSRAETLILFEDSRVQLVSAPTGMVETVTIGDSVLVNPLDLNVQAQDTVVLTSTPLAYPTRLFLSVADTVLVGDSVDIRPPFLPGLLLLDDLGLLLQNAGLGTLSTTIFKGQMPLDAPLVSIQDALISLVELPGMAPARSHDAPPRRVEQPVVQVVVRGSPHDYQGARQRAQQVWHVLDGLANQRLNNTYYLWVQSQQMPYWLRTDDFDRPLIAFTVQVAKEEDS